MVVNIVPLCTVFSCVDRSSFGKSLPCRLRGRCLRVAGSPYQYTVGKVPSGGTHKVEFGGPGVEKGEVGAKSTFFYNLITNY